MSTRIWKQIKKVWFLEKTLFFINIFLIPLIFVKIFIYYHACVCLTPYEEEEEEEEEEEKKNKKEEEEEERKEKRKKNKEETTVM